MMAEPTYTKKDKYVLELHELLWRFIEHHDLNCDRTGNVVDCAEQVLAELEPEPDEIDESMDGDHESALASAGWGTDESYGG